MSPRRRRFLGTSAHPVDKKGRMSIAKRFQNALDEVDERAAGVLCVDRDEGRCLWVFNDEGFDREMEAFETRALRDNAVSLDNQRDFFEFVTDFTLDTSGRLVIPARFRELVGIDDEAVAVGVNSRLEIWAKDAWENRPRGVDSPLTPSARGNTPSPSSGAADSSTGSPSIGKSEESGQ